MPVHRSFTRQVRSLFAILVASILFASSAPARAQRTGAPPMKSDVALNGKEIASSAKDKVGSATDCLARCKANKACTGFTFRDATCTLFEGRLTETAARGAVSCQMPCEAAESGRTPAPPTTPKVIPTPPTTPTEVPGTKAALRFSESQFFALGGNGSILLTSFNLLVLNGLRTVPGITTFLQVGAKDPAAFPDNMMKVVVKGWAAEPMGNRTLVLSQGSIVSSCQLPIQVAWRCELTLPVGSFNETQTVKMNADTRTLLSEISIESTTSPDPKVELTVPAEPAFVTMGHADLFLVGTVLVVNGIRIKQFSQLTVTASSNSLCIRRSASRAAGSFAAVAPPTRASCSGSSNRLHRAPCRRVRHVRHRDRSRRRRNVRRPAGSP